MERLETSGKKPDSVTTEKIHINQWVEIIGQIRLAKIRPHHINNQLHALRKAGKAARTCNLALVYLRNVLESARIDEHIVTSPADGLVWFKTEKKAHRLYAPDEIDRLWAAAVAPKYIKSRLATEGEQGACLKNGVQFGDYLRFLQYSGAREAEALRVCKADVDMDRGHVMIGADGDAKNRDYRRIIKKMI